MTARFLAAMSSEMQAVGVAWQVYGLTHRPLDLGLVGLAQFLPGILLFLISGHAADRIPRQRILQACYAAFSFCSLLLLALTMRGVASVYPLYAVLLMNGIVRAFNASAAIAYRVGLLLVSAIRPRSVERSRAAASLDVVLEGFKYIWRNKLLLGAISLDLFAVLLGGAVALLPVYAREILNVGAPGLGVLRSAPGMGAVVMAIVVAHWPLRRKAGAAMLLCVFGFGAFTVVFGLSRNLALSLAALVLMGACDMVSVIIRHTMLQLATPDDMRGRVSAVNSVFIGVSNEVGQFESGITAQWFGTVPAVILGGVGTMAIVALWAWVFPSLRKVNELSPSVAVKTAEIA